MKSWFKKYWLLFVLLFAFGVFIRPYIHGKISNNNHNLIITLTAVENWLEEGVSFHNYNIIHSWDKKGDIGHHYYPRVMNEAGRNYFVSYPPLSFLIFYGAVNVISPNDLVSFFKEFGAALHCLTFIVLFLTLRKKLEANLAILLSGIFLFFPANIVLSNMYYPEQLILLLMVTTVYILEHFQGRGKDILCYVLGFLLVYCDWLGFLLVASYGVFQFFIKKEKLGWLEFSLVTGGVLGGMVLVLQYASINGIDGLIQGLKVRYLERSGVFTEEFSDRGVNLFNSNSFTYLKNHLLPTVLGSIVILIFLQKKFKLVFRSSIFWIVILPIFFHIVFLFNSNILHFQNLGKLSLLFTLGSIAYLSFKHVSQVVVFGLLSIYISTSSLIVNNYFSQYPSGELTYDKASFLESLLDDSLPVIILQDNFTEDLVLLSYLLKRNVICKSSKAEVLSFLEENENHASALLFNWERKSVERINQ